MGDIKDIFNKEGETIIVSGNTPFLITNSDDVWLINSGEIDLFAVSMKNSQPSGARNHIGRFSEGQALFGISEQSANKETGLLALGSTNTQLKKLDTGRILELTSQSEYSDSIINLTEEWIQNLSHNIFKTIAQNDSIKLQAGNQIQLPDKAVANSNKIFLWIKSLSGDFTYLSIDEISINKNFYIPIFGKIWIESKGDSTIESIDTKTLLTRDKELISINNFYGLIFQKIKVNIELANQKEIERLTEKETLEEKNFINSFRRLATILNPKVSEYLAESNINNPIFNACKLVGRKLGIEIKLDPDELKGRKVKDPVGSIARASKIRVREVSLEGEWWKKDNGPLVAWLNDDTPVALINDSDNSYNIVNPKDNSIKKLTENNQSLFRSQAYTFYRALPTGKLNGKELLKFAFFGCKKDLWIVVLMGIAGGLLGLLTPYFTGIIFDNVIPNSDKSQLAQLFYILIISAFAVAMFQLTRSIAMLRIEGKSDSSLQSALWDRLLNLPATFFRNYTSGNLAVRALGINAITEALTGATVTTILSSIFSVFNFFLLFYYDAGLAIWVTIYIVIVLIVTLLIGYWKLRYQRKAQKLIQDISGLALQLLNGISKLRITGTEKNAFNEWSKVFTEQKENEFKESILQNRLTVFYSVVPIISSIILFVNIAFVKEGGEIETGIFVGFFTAFSIFLAAMISLGQSLTSLFGIIPYYENALPIFEELPESDETKAEAPDLKGNIEVNNVVFSYEDESPVVLKGVSFYANSGEFVAIVGPSGAGKSTIIRMLLGFDKSKSGSVFYDGCDLLTLDPQSVRKQMGVVLQNGELFPGVIMQNIIGTSNLTIGDAWEAAKMAGIDEDIKNMPMGMFTVISEGANTISGGQKQRIMIARALVNKPRILLFDEATSALDNESQEIVSKSIESLHSTRIVIAHRLSTIINADRIYVLVDGKIVETGKYQELMDKKGTFYDLAIRQLI